MPGTEKWQELVTSRSGSPWHSQQHQSMGSAWHTQGHLHIAEKAGTRARIPAHCALPTLDFGCISKTVTVRIPRQEEQLLSAAGTTGKANFLRAYKPQCSISPPASPATFFLPSFHVPYHRGEQALPVRDRKAKAAILAGLCESLLYLHFLFLSFQPFENVSPTLSLRGCI